MQTIEAKIHVGADRQLRIDLPDTVLVGEYEVVLVLNQRSAAEVDAADEIALGWEKWFGEVDQLSLLEGPGEGEFSQHLVAKYRQQGLDL